jgi:hypothetical protein
MKNTIVLTTIIAMFTCFTSSCKKEKEEEARAKFFGSFNAVTNCDVTAYTVTISTSNLGENYVTIENLLDDQSLPVFGILQSNNSITISQQTVSSYIVSGNIEFDNDVITSTIYYNESVAGVNNTCYGNLTRL